MNRLWGTQYNHEEQTWEVIRYEKDQSITVMDTGFDTCLDATRRRGEMCAEEQGIPFEGLEIDRFNQDMLDEVESRLSSDSNLKSIKAKVLK
jgi:hypothetical protein